ERSAKKSTTYLRIRRLLEQEHRVRHFLYVVPEPKLASFILECFAGTPVRLFVVLAAEFTRSFKDMNLTEATSGRMRPMAEAFILFDDSASAPHRLRDGSPARR